MEKIQAGVFILYVTDQQRSTAFYRTVLNTEPVLDVPGMTEFQISRNMKIGIMPESGIARLICPAAPHPELGNGIPRSEVYLYVSDPQAYLDRATGAGATLISALQSRDWGDEAGYVMDLDGHILAFAKEKV